MNEELKKTVRAVQGMEQYDESVKQVLAHKIILANILVNIEAQKDEPSSYYIQNRAAFYACQMVSSQKERDFTGMNYNDIKKVYTIWICMNQKENSLNYLHLTNEKLMGKTAIEKAGDLIHIILLGLAKNLPPYTEKNKLHRLLGALFTNELTADKKISIIESEYNIEAKNELRKDVRKVSGLGESLVESAAEEAWEQGLELGGKQREIKFIISMNEKGYTIEQIADVTEKSREEVEAVLEKSK